MSKVKVNRQDYNQHKISITIEVEDNVLDKRTLRYLASKLSREIAQVSATLVPNEEEE